MFGLCPNQVQQKAFTGYIDPAPGSPACADAEHIRTWLNTNADADISPGWSNEVGGWQIGWSANWDNTTNTDPDMGTVIGPGGSALPGGGVYSFTSQYGVDTATWGAFLLPSATAYIVAVWCDDDGTRYYQASCTMTGTPIGGCCGGSGWEYIIPVPPETLCNASFEQCATPSYFLVPVADYGGWFGTDWTTFVSDCVAGTGEFLCKTGVGVTSPTACLSPDPFFGDDP